jgi:hypothetical protein
MKTICHFVNKIYIRNFVKMDTLLQRTAIVFGHENQKCLPNS